MTAEIPPGRAKRFGPFSLVAAEESGSRLWISAEALEESGLNPDGTVLLQPYHNGIHLIKAKEAALGPDTAPVDDVEQPICPVCRTDPGDATASMAPSQAVCASDDCPVTTWRMDRRVPGPVGSYLPEEVEP